MSKSVMIIDTPSDCCDCPFGTMAFGKSICLLDEGNGIDCPLKPYEDFIPIEWVEKWVDMLKERNYHSYQVLMPALIEMLGTWEKENESETKID